jgi:hypothetical protein
MNHVHILWVLSRSGIWNRQRKEAAAFVWLRLDSAAVIPKKHRVRASFALRQRVVCESQKFAGILLGHVYMFPLRPEDPKSRRSTKACDIGRMANILF